MKILTLTEPTTQEYIKIQAEERGVEPTKIISYHPPEDAFAVSETKLIFAVADGVTMLEYVYDESGDVKKKVEYPRESAAAKAAKIFCDSAVRVLKDNQTVTEVFSTANQEIGQMNEKEGRIPTKDYFWNYPGSTVGVLAKIKDRIIEYGFVADCGLLILHGSGQIKFQTPNRLKTEKICCREWLEQNGFKWETKTQYIRLLQQECINHPERKVGDCRVGYGHLNGHPGALGFVETGKLQITVGDTVVLYSDGFENHFKAENFRQALANLNEKSLRSVDAMLVKENAKTYGSERTLVAVRMD